MKKLLDPIANTKTIGYLFVFLGIFGIVTYLPSLLKVITPEALYGLSSAPFYLIIGFGLINIKKWGLHGLILLTSANILYGFYYLNTHSQFNTIVIISNLFFILICIWLYSANKKFR